MTRAWSLLAGAGVTAASVALLLLGRHLSKESRA